MKKLDGEIFWYCEIGALIIDHCVKSKIERELNIEIPDEVWNENDVEEFFAWTLEDSSAKYTIRTLLEAQANGEPYQYITKESYPHHANWIIAKVWEVV